MSPGTPHDFADYTINNVEYIASVNACIILMNIIDAAYQSVEIGKLVKI